MKRKILSLALIAALVFALSVSAFAATDVPSGTDTDVLPDSEQGTLVYDPEEIKKIEDEVCAEGFISNSGLTTDVQAAVNAVTPSGKKVDDYKLDLVAAFNFAADEATKAAATANGSVDVTFTNIAGVKAGAAVVVLHQKSNGEWEVLPAKATADGTVVATFKEFSPVAIVVATVTYSDATTPSTPSTDTTVRSPQTSDIG